MYVYLCVYILFIRKISCNFFKIFYLKESRGEKRGWEETLASSQMGHSASGCSGGGWARLKSGARSFLGALAGS